LFSDPVVTSVVVNAPKEVLVERMTPSGSEVSRSEISFGSSSCVRDVDRLIGNGCQIAGRTTLDRVQMTPGGAVVIIIDGWRICVFRPPVSLQTSLVFIRILSASPFSLDRLVELGSLSEEIAGLLRKTLVAGSPIVISGPARAGKTALLEALLGEPYLLRPRRCVVIDDQQGLSVPKGANWLSLMPVPGVSTADLVEVALLSRPNALVVNELHGPGSFKLIEAMGSGLPILVTLQSSSASSAVRRLETLARSELSPEDIGLRTLLRESLGASGATVIHLERTADGRRVVEEVIMVKGLTERENAFRVQPLFALSGDPSLTYTDREPPFAWTEHWQDEERTL
jgi:pilus assembly protein CpaF